MFRKMLIGAAALVVFAASPAAAQYCFTATPSTVVPGGTVAISGEGCSVGAEVVLTLTQISSTRAIGDSFEVATLTADENGEFSTEFTVPTDTELGSYELSATCNGQEVSFLCDGEVDSVVIDVVDDTVTTTPPSGNTEPIVRTGSDLNGLALAGAALIAVGGIVLIATRNRRHQARA